ncbi:hypothetical protein LL845_004470 [Salmonella enterica]|uniref:Uncharacterized protein n=5 Tax=Salmonella enterica TaxID=28901 RepID=A0A5W1Z7J2_SALNE|nr:hypothetical protein [Salmonella enterica]EAW1341045.1 hypothetical protein [Salmonella enterica subsp. enterica]EHM5733908.1 hypothetical protein [Salmonella enterica subsp. enterica serovar Luciana]EAB4924584.1 hypothetical protein [Salmonella enterica]EAB4973493.1 hypothetical protein [Salmonella enterica]EAM2843002.1 hypothetical protein [Salmonella enterica]
MNHNLLWRAVAFTVSHEEIHVFVEAPDSVTAQKRCYERLAEEWNVVTDNRFVGLPLLIFTIVFIPPIFIGVHILFLILVNLVLLTERSDRDVWRHRSENDLSVIGIIRPAVVSPTPFYSVFSVLYFSGVICSVVTSDGLLAIGGEV